MKLMFGVIAIVGYFFNIKEKRKVSYIIWLISNSLWSIYSFIAGEYELGVMFLMYDAFCIYGIFNKVTNNQGSYD